MLAARHPPCCHLSVSPPVQGRKENQVNKTTGRDKEVEITYQLLSQAKKKKITWKKLFNLLTVKMELKGVKQRQNKKKLK